MTKFEYDDIAAEKRYRQIISSSRNQLSFTTEQLHILGRHVRQEIEKKRSAYQALLSCDEVEMSSTTFYRLLENGKIPKVEQKSILFKKTRRKALKQYEYNENKLIDRSGRTYLDFLAYTTNSHYST